MKFEDFNDKSKYFTKIYQKCGRRAKKHQFSEMGKSSVFKHINQTRILTGFSSLQIGNKTMPNTAQQSQIMMTILFA